jgi:hypothetical protein
MRNTTSRALAAALTAALALASLDIAPAQAAGTVEMSAHRHWRHGNGAVLGAVAGLFGTIAVLAANDRYQNGYYYGGSPYYYGSYGYGGPYVYGPRYHYWHRHWR